MNIDEGMGEGIIGLGWIGGTPGGIFTQWNGKSRNVVICLNVVDWMDDGTRLLLTEARRFSGSIVDLRLKNVSMAVALGGNAFGLCVPHQNLLGLVIPSERFHPFPGNPKLGQKARFW